MKPIKQQVDEDVYWNEIYKQVLNRVDIDVWVQVERQIRNKVEKRIDDEMRDQIISQLHIIYNKIERRN